MIKTKSSYSFEDRSTDGETDGIYFLVEKSLHLIQEILMVLIHLNTECQNFNLQKVECQ